MIYFILLFELFSFISSFSTMEECSLWAKEGECIKNPRYLWAHCLESCMEYAKDDHEQCNNWASIGECSKNPAYVQVHCPQSCGYSLNWNPYTRQSLHIEFLTYPFHDYVRFESNCYVITSQNNIEGANSLYIAGVTMHHRLSNLLKHASYYGFSRTSPSEFLLSYGIIEGMLYSIHLYEIVANASLQSRPSVYDNTPSIAQEFVKINLYPISDVKTKLYKSLTSDSDALTRTIFSNLELLDKAKDHLTILLNQTTIEYGGTNDVCLSGIGNVELNVSNVLPAYITSYHPTIEKNQPISSFYTLSNGIIMPSLGLGTWQLNGNLCEEIVFDAIQIGYRHIDTAQAYGNEKEVGNAILRALNEGIVKREDLFIATKLSFDVNSKDEFITLLNEQMKLLNVNYIDLYYLHSPIHNEEILIMIWKVLNEYYHKGLIRSFGISNFDTREIQYLYSVIQKISSSSLSETQNSMLSSSPSSPSSSLSVGLPVPIIKPHVLQNKYDIYHPGRQLDNTGIDIETIAKNYGIQLVGYSPFSSFPFSLLPLYDPILLQLSKSYNNESQERKVSDIIIQWMIQRGVGVLFRSSSKEHLINNFNSILNTNGLTNDEMRTISSISSLVYSPFFKKLIE